MTRTKAAPGRRLDAAVHARPVDSLSVLDRSAADGLSPAQQRFHAAIRHHETLSARLAASQRAIDRCRQHEAAELRAAQIDSLATERDLARWLAQRLGQPGLTAKEQQTLKHIILRISEGAARAGDAEMLALYDKHADQTMATRRAAEAKLAQAVLRERAAHLLPPQRADTSLEEMLEALRTLAKAQSEKKEARQRARLEKRERRKAVQAPLSASSGHSASADADETLRCLYRRLAKLVHPDLERDAIERRRKTDLMTQANLAYARRDVMTLLRLQLDLLGGYSPEKVTELAQSQLTAMTTLLNEHNSQLQSEIDGLERQAALQWDLPAHIPFTEQALSNWFVTRTEELRAGTRVVRGELNAIHSEPSELKEWLKVQRKAIAASTP